MKRRTYSYTSSQWSLTTDRGLYSGWSLIEERDGSGTLLAAYANGPVLDEVLAKFTGTNTVFYHGDSLNSTLALSDASGSVLERYRYDAFGLPSVFDSTFNLQPSTAFGNRMLFQGREWLAGVKLNDHRHRYYTPELQRWICKDPIGEEGGMNLYVFAVNSPTMASDPFGLNVWSAMDCACRQQGGVPTTVAACMGYSSTWQCANAFSLDPGLSALLGVIGLTNPVLGVGIGLGIAANWAVAWSNCSGPTCCRNGAPTLFRGLCATCYHR